MAGIADDYARELDRLEERAEANTIALLRTSLANVLRDLRRSYSQYLETLGPLEEDPAGNPIRRPGAYTAGESAVKFRAILRDASGFLNDTELQAWQAQFEQDLRQATELGGRIGQDLSELVMRPDEVVPFAGADPLVTRTAAAISAAYIQGEGARFRDQIVQIVGEGASRGWGPKRLELGIREALEGADDPNGITQRMGLKQRAALIARSELANAYVRATIERSQRQGFSYVRALASNDERVCPICASRNGRVYPADRIAMPWHPRCVLGDTHVSPGLLAAVIRSRYRGDVVTVGLESGERLTVTANHPMLTPSGWVKAETLRHGDQLVGHGLHRTRSIVGEAPDLHQMPATAEDVFAAFSNSGTVTTVSVPVTPLDLHGDGAFIEGNVDVVRADGLLECYRDVEGLNAASQEAGIIGGVRFRPFASLSYADAGLLWHAATAAGSMSRLREAQALLRGGLSHAEQHRIATTAWRDPVLVQELGDGVALYAKALRHGLDAAAFLECPECGSIVEDQAVSSERQASRGQVTPDDTGGDAIGSGDSGSAQAGLVEIHKVASIEINPFHGFVYTFETFSGAYSIGADSRILTQNCRCVAVPVTNEAVTETDPESREVLLDNDRWRKEHDRGVEVYAKGRHKQKIETLRRQVDRAKDGDRKDQLSAQLDRLIERGPDIVKARTELAQALKTPSASERRLFGKGTKALQESVPLYPPR